jgi:hypothetical protein
VPLAVHVNVGNVLGGGGDWQRARREEEEQHLGALDG